MLKFLAIINTNPWWSNEEGRRSSRALDKETDQLLFIYFINS